MTIEQIVEQLKRILALCDNPHWSTDRKYKIRDITADLLKNLEVSNAQGR